MNGLKEYDGNGNYIGGGEIENFSGIFSNRTQLALEFLLMVRVQFIQVKRTKNYI